MNTEKPGEDKPTGFFSAEEIQAAVEGWSRGPDGHLTVGTVEHFTAKMIAEASIERYGVYAGHEMERMRKHGIWTDDPSYQAALAAIRLMQTRFGS